MRQHIGHTVRRRPWLRFCAAGRRGSSEPPIPDPRELLGATLEQVADGGRQVLNLALAATGSKASFPRRIDPQESLPAPAALSGRPDGARDSVFWDPFRPGSPFLDREVFLAEHLARSVSIVSTSQLVPDADVEEYVDFLLSSSVLTNTSLPFGTGRQLFIRVVRIVLRVIVNSVELVDGKEMLGKRFVFIKEPSSISGLRGSSAPLDHRVVARLAARAIGDHVQGELNEAGKPQHGYLLELGLPLPLVERLYADLIALTLRLVLDVCLTFKVRCLGHALTCRIEADELLHLAPGWEVALDAGAFGTFEDTEKRSWATAFAHHLLEDESVRLAQLPESVQAHLYSRLALVMLNVGETALNHFRVHIAGMAFRPALCSQDAEDTKPMAQLERQLDVIRQMEGLNEGNASIAAVLAEQRRLLQSKLRAGIASKHK